MMRTLPPLSLFAFGFAYVSALAGEEGAKPSWFTIVKRST
jgi:hypothetical protein